MNYKLAVFGDSFADNKGPLKDTLHGWHHMLCEQNGWDLEETVNFGASGSNNWAAYRRLLDFIEEGHTADNYVFSVTDQLRFPMSGEQQNYSYEYSMCYINGNETNGPQGAPSREAAKQVNLINTEQSLYDLFNAFWHVNFESNKYMGPVTFINRSIWLEINRYCTKHNLNLVTLIPFRSRYKDYLEWYAPEHSYITGLDEVSRAEVGAYEENYDGVKWFGSQPYNDARINHLCKHNNILLAEIINNMLKSNDVQGVDFTETPGIKDWQSNAIEEYGEIIFLNS